MRYWFDSNKGRLEIVQDQSGRWLLMVNGTAQGSYHSARSAADDAHCTISYAVPEDIGEWHRSA